METRIEHPCVTSNHIKLDILNLLDIKKKHFVPPSTTASKYEYWYPGYTTVSILMCLEGTLATLHVCALIVFLLTNSIVFDIIKNTLYTPILLLLCSSSV